MAKIEKKIRKILEALGREDSEVSVIFSNDACIRKLNKEFRNIDAPTDVLSFSQNEGEFSFVHSGLLGDVVISAEWANREAMKAGRSKIREIDFLLIHGILHLLGFDHEKSDKERAIMKQREEEIFALLETPET
ncbi:MAG: rRNA maturation RNase YbeY [Nitrospinota bacterium]